MKPNAKTLLLSSLVALTASAVAMPALAETFYRCETGFAFESAGNAARCRRPPGVQRTALTNCAPFFDVRTDRLNNGRDQCVQNNPVTGPVGFNRTCPMGYNYRVEQGVDSCERTTPEEVRSPTVAVNR